MIQKLPKQKVSFKPRKSASRPATKPSNDMKLKAVLSAKRLLGCARLGLPKRQRMLRESPPLHQSGRQRMNLARSSAAASGGRHCFAVCAQSPLAFGGVLTTNTSVQMSVNTQWRASARARLGYIWPNNMMWYATGGAAWANIEYAGQEAAELPIAATDFRSVTSFHTTKNGWVVGGGAEWMATPNILLRAEYLYYSFNSGTNTSANLFPNPGAFPAPFNYYWASYNVQIFRIGGEYKF
jgi:opacity protein-like surface antigen